MLIYKILLPAEWAEFDAAGRFGGSPFDHSSGFIHCSARGQVAGVAQRLFAGEPELVVVALDADVLAELVRWEGRPGEEAFPHVYASLPRSAVVAVYRIAGAGEVDATLPWE